MSHAMAHDEPRHRWARFRLRRTTAVDAESLDRYVQGHHASTQLQGGCARRSAGHRRQHGLFYCPSRDVPVPLANRCSTFRCRGHRRTHILVPRWSCRRPTCAPQRIHPSTGDGVSVFLAWTGLAVAFGSLARLASALVARRDPIRSRWWVLRPRMESRISSGGWQDAVEWLGR